MVRLSRFILLLIVLIVFSSCGGISILKPGDRSDLYRDAFIKQINQVKQTFKVGKKEEAVRSLKIIDDAGLLPAEKALKYNLLGVIQYSDESYEKAIYSFEAALTTSSLDNNLTSQINLNLASSFFKLGLIHKSWTYLERIDYKQLVRDEEKKYHHLKYLLANQLGYKDFELESLIRYLGLMDSLISLKQSKLLEVLIEKFNQLSKSEKVSFLEEFEDNKYISAAYLSYLEAEKMYYEGNRENAIDMIGWVRKNFGENKEILDLINNFDFRVNYFVKINPNSIGVVLPFDSKNERFAERALKGIDFCFQKRSMNSKFKPVLHVRDSEGSAKIAKLRIRQLIENKNVSVIIGGLTSSEATEGYLEAKKYGVLFISLKPVHLPRSQKNNLLIEIPGSIESQVDKILSPEMLEVFGRKVAVVYPNDVNGKAYVNEFWENAQKKEVEVTSLQSFDSNKTDFTTPLSNLLGLKFKRERQEELEILSKVYSLEKKGNVRRIQTLPPVIDFDWVFMPVNPKEASLLIPTFQYLDVYKMNYIGGPSWRSRRLSKSKLRSLIFVGDSIESISPEVKKDFFEKYQKPLGVVEIVSYDAMKLIFDLFESNEFSTREEFELHLKSLEKIRGISGQWENKNSLWIKDMMAIRHSRGNMDKVQLPSLEEIKSKKNNINQPSL